MIWSIAAGLFGLLTLSIPVGIALFLLGFGTDVFYHPFPLIKGLGNLVWSTSNTATRTYAALDHWVSRLPGGLVHANIATAAMPQAEKLGYDPKLFSGAIAAGGTLDIMIPPSISRLLRLFDPNLDPAAVFGESVLGTVKITSLIMRVVIGGSFLDFTLASAGLGRELQAFLDGLGLSPMVVAIPIIVPLVVAQGFDPIWLGILMIGRVEMALITPPVGLNLYVVHGARKGGKMPDVMLGAIPDAFAILLMVAALIAFPQIALMQPNALE